MCVHSGFSMWSGPPTAHDNVRPAVAEQSVRFDTAVPTLPNHCHHFHVKHKRVLEEGTGKCGCDMLHYSLAACRQMKRSHWTGGLALKGAWSWRLAAARLCLNTRAPLLHSWRRFTERATDGPLIRTGHRLFFFPFWVSTGIVKLKDSLSLCVQLVSRPLCLDTAFVANIAS